MAFLFTGLKSALYFLGANDVIVTMENMTTYTEVFRIISALLHCCDVASDIAVITLLRFLSKPSNSLHKRVTIPTDQI